VGGAGKVVRVVRRATGDPDTGSYGLPTGQPLYQECGKGVSVRHSGGVYYKRLNVKPPNV
jgi:hypothetical protein